MKRITRWQDVTTGMLGSIEGKGFISESIEHMTQRNDLLDGVKTPSHSFVVINPMFVIESLSHTVLTPLASYRQAFDEGRVVFYEPPIPVEIRAKALRTIRRSYLGADYGWGQILAFLPVLFWRRLTGHRAPNLLPIGTICSELALMAIREYRKEAVAAGLHDAARRLVWSVALNRQITDPALLLACEQRDALPPTLDGSRA